MFKKSIILILALCLATALFAGCFNTEVPEPTEPTEPNSPEAVKEGYVLDWQDEFDGDALDFKKWMPQYLPHATTSSDGFLADYEVSNGSLKLMIDANRPTFYESDSEQGFKVSGIQTYNKFSLHEKGKSSAMVAPYNGYTTQYGYFEIRCKLPAGGGGGHVAFWMVGTQADARADGSGSLQTGEIDIIETPFYEPNVHYPRVFSWTDEDLTTWYDAVPLEGDYVNDWHTFAGGFFYLIRCGFLHAVPCVFTVMGFNVCGCLCVCNVGTIDAFGILERYLVILFHGGFSFRSVRPGRAVCVGLVFSYF